MKPPPLVLLAVLLTAHAALAETCDQIGHAPGEEGRVQSDFCQLPNWYLARISLSVIASHRRSGVVRM